MSDTQPKIARVVLTIQDTDGNTAQYDLPDVAGTVTVTREAETHPEIGPDRYQQTIRPTGRQDLTIEIKDVGAYRAYWVTAAAAAPSTGAEK